MSDVGRYRKAYPRIWRHPGFRQLSRDEQRLTLYLLHGPQTNRVGLFHFSVFTAAEDLDTTPETLKKGLANVTVTFGWMFDSDAKVFYIPSWWRWNPPENPKVMAGSLKDLNEVPPCSLVDAFAENIAHIPTKAVSDGRTILETFLEGIHQRLPKRSTYQKQEQEQDAGTGKQEPSALRAEALKRSASDTPAIDSNLQKIARNVIKQNGPTADIDTLVDHFLYVCRQSNINGNRTTALHALTGRQIVAVKNAS